jgi:type IV pilus assembly protein PilM
MPRQNGYAEEHHDESALADDADNGELLGHDAGLEAVTEGNGASVATAGDLSSLATVYCYIGGLTNLAIAVGTNCVFNRVLHNGIESMAATLAERKGLTLDHSREWLRYVGLERDLQNIEGEQEIITEAREVLENGARRIADEVRLSIEYYHSTVPDAPRVGAAVMAGPGIAIAGLNTLFEHELGMPVEARSMGQIEVEPGALDGVDGPSLTVATGLALDEVTG